MARFILTAQDDDSVLAGKLFVHHDPECVHLSASRRFNTLPEDADIIFIRPWIKYTDLLSHERYGGYRLTVFHTEGSSFHVHEKELTDAGITCIWISQETSFSKAVWEYLHHTTEYPLVVNWVHDYMKWELKLDESIPFHYGLAIIDAKYSKPISDLYVGLIDGDVKQLYKIVHTGEQIRQYVDVAHAVLAKELIYSSYIGKYSVLVANCPKANSSFFAQHGTYGDYDFCIALHLDFRSNKIRHTLYRINPELSMLDIAKPYGGGGTSGVGSITTEGSLVADYGESPWNENINYTALLDSEEAPDCVKQYAESFFRITPTEIGSVIIDGVQALIANSPYLPMANPFKHITVLNETLGILVCLQGNHNLRVAYRNLDGTDPGPQYGIKVGPYRIQTNLPQIDGLQGLDFPGNLFG